MTASDDDPPRGDDEATDLAAPVALPADVEPTPLGKPADLEPTPTAAPAPDPAADEPTPIEAPAVDPPPRITEERTPLDKPLEPVADSGPREVPPVADSGSRTVIDSPVPPLVDSGPREVVDSAPTPVVSSSFPVEPDPPPPRAAIDTTRSSASNPRLDRGSASHRRLAGAPDEPTAIVAPLETARRWWHRLWVVIPLALVGALILARALLHVPPLDQLAVVAGQPLDPPNTIARAGSLAVTRGGPIVVGFVSDGPARLTIAGREVRGRGLVKERLVVPAGPLALRFAAPGGARLVWSPVGRRGDPEYVGASSLSPEPPATARFEAPGTSRLDGAIALGLLAVGVGTALALARRRLARVSRETWIAMALVGAAALAVRLVGLGDQGQTWDEDVNWAAGKNYITNVLDLDFSAAAWSWNYEHPPVMKLLAGIGAQLVDGFGVARALSALWVAIGCALLVPIGARLYQLRIGVLAGAIAALLPPLVAHGQIVGHEAPTVLWWSLGILLALALHDGVLTRRELIGRLVALGAVVGIAVASRFVNGLLGPLVALIVVVQAPERWRRMTLGWGAIVLPLATIAAFYAVWPRLWLDPIGALEHSLAKLDTLHAIEPFLGEVTNKPPAYYFVVYLGATLPVGILAGVAAWLLRAVRDVRAPGAPRRATVILLAWFAVPLVVGLSPVKQDGVRYVMPCVLALALMAAAGLHFVASLVARAFDRRRVRGQRAMTSHTDEHRYPHGFGVLLAATVIYLGITLARVRPYYLDYFGEHVGGAGAVAERRWFETAWWGEGLDRAIAYVNANARPGDRIFNGCVLPNHLTWYREDLWSHATRTPHEASWIVHYAPASTGCPVRKGARRVFDVRVDGAPLAIVYQYP